MLGDGNGSQMTRREESEANWPTAAYLSLLRLILMGSVWFCHGANQVGTHLGVSVMQQYALERDIGDKSSTRPLLVAKDVVFLRSDRGYEMSDCIRREVIARYVVVNLK